MLKLSLLAVLIQGCLGGILVLSQANAAPLPVFPLDPEKPNSSTVHYGAGRFGEGRTSGGGYPRGYGTYGHQGVDISGPMGKELYAMMDAVVVGAMDTGGGGGVGTALKPINGPDIVVVYWHQKNLRKGLGVGTKVKAGEFIGRVGNTSKPIENSSSGMSPHLHLGVGIRNPSEAVNIWLHNVPRSGGQFYKIGLGGSGGGASHTKSFQGKSYLWTNPAPYLPRDVIIRTSLGNNDPLIKFYGNSIRSQYNALTGANLPLGPGAKKGELADQVPKVKIKNNGVPSSMQTEAAQGAVISAIESGNAEEILGQDSITPEVLAYYAPPRTIFTGNQSEVKIDIGDGDITQSELVEKIGNSRFGNSEWQKEIIGASMRAMLGELLNMINAKNFIKKEQIKQKERIESLYAAWVSNLVKLNIEGELQQISEKAIGPDIMPEVSTLTVEELFELVDQGMDVSSYDLSAAVSLTEGGYKNCDRAYLSNFAALGDAKRKELLSLALRMGFHPNDLATVVAVETSFNRNLDNVYRKATTYVDKNGKTRTSNPAGGYIQLTPGGAGDIPYDALVQIYPGAKPIITKHLGNNMKSGAMNRAHGPYLRELGNANPRWEFAVYDAYFFSKNRALHSVKPSEKTLGRLYKMVIGNGYSQNSKNEMIRKGYEQNKQYDLNRDGKFTPEEAVQHPMFRKRYCPYFNDADILNNKYGLSDADLKFIPWNGALSRAQSPTLKNLGGNFMFIQGLKAKKTSMSE